MWPCLSRLLAGAPPLPSQQPRGHTGRDAGPCLGGPARPAVQSTPGGRPPPSRPRCEAAAWEREGPRPVPWSVGGGRTSGPILPPLCRQDPSPRAPPKGPPWPPERTPLPLPRLPQRPGPWPPGAWRQDPRPDSALGSCVGMQCTSGAHGLTSIKSSGRHWASPDVPPG